MRLRPRLGRIGLADFRFLTVRSACFDHLTGGRLLQGKSSSRASKARKPNIEAMPVFNSLLH